MYVALIIVALCIHESICSHIDSRIGKNDSVVTYTRRQYVFTPNARTVVCRYEHSVGAYPTLVLRFPIMLAHNDPSLTIYIGVDIGRLSHNGQRSHIGHHHAYTYAFSLLSQKMIVLDAIPSANITLYYFGTHNAIIDVACVLVFGYL